jgi:hypothetical protein
LTVPSQLTLQTELERCLQFLSSADAVAEKRHDYACSLVTLRRAWLYASLTAIRDQTFRATSSSSIFARLFPYFFTSLRASARSRMVLFHEVPDFIVFATVDPCSVLRTTL